MNDMFHTGVERDVRSCLPHLLRQLLSRVIAPDGYDKCGGMLDMGGTQNFHTRGIAKSYRASFRPCALGRWGVVTDG